MILKTNLDRALAWGLFHEKWTIDGYLLPPKWIGEMLSDSAQWPRLLFFSAASLPFLLAGVWLTVRRLRSAGLGLWLSVLFVVPLAKFVLFAVLVVYPPRRQSASNLSTSHHRGLSAFASGAIGIGVTASLGGLMVWFTTSVLRSYGWSLFLGLPFVLGFTTTMLYSPGGAHSLGKSIGVSFLSLLACGLFLLLFAMEGVICLLMALPIAVPVLFLGTLTAHLIQTLRVTANEGRQYCIALLALLPAGMFWESSTNREPLVSPAVTTIEIDAPPALVWKNVVEFSEIPEARAWIFHTGIAYPIRARIEGTGVGAIRHCEFSTGSFIEPIEVWDEPRLLKFSVVSTPKPMQEWTFYTQLHPPHLHGFMLSKAGQFRLIELAGGRTRLEGTTWYSHGLYPESYWRLWSDRLIHAIHRRVLEHIKREAEPSAS